MSDLGVIKHLDIEPSLLNFNGFLDIIHNKDFIKFKKET